MMEGLDAYTKYEFDILSSARSSASALAAGHQNLGHEGTAKVLHRKRAVKKTVSSWIWLRKKNVNVGCLSGNFRRRKVRGVRHADSLREGKIRIGTKRVGTRLEPALEKDGEKNRSLPHLDDTSYY
jgi:hypothetical protein